MDVHLPLKLREVTLLFVVPPKNTVGSFARSVQQQLQTPTPPRLVAQPAGDVLPESMNIVVAHKRWSAGKQRMQVSVAGFAP